MPKLRLALPIILHASILLVGLVGCGLVPPPSHDVPKTQAANPAPQATNTRATTVPTLSGFTDYERAALRVRNVNIGCGGVSSGSGFAISDHVFVTNRHVIGGAAVLQVSTYDGHDIEVTTAGAVVIADLALVWTNEQLPATIPLAPENPTIGTNVTAVGYPLGGPLTTTHGKVLGYGPDPVGWSSLPMLVNDAPIEHGSSGSPLINDRGQLVGVVYASDGDQFAVPVIVLREVLNNPSDFSNSSACRGHL
ncbi:S1 family peptidase [Arthrobacter sp. FW306-06-A]|uniref:S1 family peptidase n=1 Tax=Arthrobacter sp. FW306-06-A TaxID=2879621 RepID=UPI001F394A91|nr:serine protease [Arthrobacter sp. FW306-06-A]UKA73563.1 serine protease [Arthrobacter sp. FW306-06-A]